MSALCPEVPENAQRTNCWTPLIIIDLIFHIAGIVTACASGNWHQSFEIIINIIIDVIIWYHTAYTITIITNDEISIKMGPHSWLCGWCFSSNLRKDEIYSIHRKQRQICFDIFPRFYCTPVNWCCCHKSYSSYWWPCCCNDNKCCKLNGPGVNDDGSDSNTMEMIEIKLSESPFEFSTMCFKRCAPCPLPWSILFCCVYNTVAVSVKNGIQIEQQLKDAEYPLVIINNNNSVADENTPLTQSVGGNSGQQQQDTQGGGRQEDGNDPEITKVNV